MTASAVATPSFGKMTLECLKVTATLFKRIEQFRERFAKHIPSHTHGIDRVIGKNRFVDRWSEMNSMAVPFCVNHRALLSASALLSLPALLRVSSAFAQDSGSQLPSWNDGAAKQAIIDFVRATTDQGSPKFVPPEERIATFDQDGTLWVEHPMYTQVLY